MNKTTKSKRKTVKTEEKTNSLADQLNQVPFANEELEEAQTKSDLDAFQTNLPDPEKLMDEVDAKLKEEMEKNRQYAEEVKEYNSQLFDQWDAEEFSPNDYNVEVPIDSLESRVGYSSLVRQLHNYYSHMIAFYRSFAGGSLSIEEARERAFRRCENIEEAKKIFFQVMSYPYENIFFGDLHELYGYAPRVGERLWERIKTEGRAEFESGHLSANTMFPVQYMKSAWNVARYLGIRESFISEWQPKGGIEISMIDMLAQTFFQWQYWMEQVVLRSQTTPREEHYEYQKWKQRSEKTKDAHSWQEGYWFPPYVHEQTAIEHAVQMVDRFNRIYMRTLRQLRDLRRYSPVTINNPSQVNIATDGGKQINVTNGKGTD